MVILFPLIPRQHHFIFENSETVCVSWVHPQGWGWGPIGPLERCPRRGTSADGIPQPGTSAWRQGWKVELSAAAMSQLCDLGMSPPWPGSTAVAQAQGPFSVTRSLQGHWDGGRALVAVGLQPWCQVSRQQQRGDSATSSRCLRKQPVSGGKPGHRTPGKPPEGPAPRLAQTPGCACGNHSRNNSMKK